MDYIINIGGREIFHSQGVTDVEYYGLGGSFGGLPEQSWRKEMTSDHHGNLYSINLHPSFILVSNGNALSSFRACNAYVYNDIAKGCSIMVILLDD